MKIIARHGISSIAWLTLALFLRGSPLSAAAYLSGSTIVVPNDADSPYTLAEIAEDISDTAYFSYDAVSCIATCAAHLSISGTVHIGMVAGDGSYDAGGKQEKLKMFTNTNNQIIIKTNGTLIARGLQGVYGVRRTSAEVLTNEICRTHEIYPKYFSIIVNSGGMIELYDTRVYGGSGSGGGAGGGAIFLSSNFDIQRCQLYSYAYYGVAAWFDRGYTTTKIFRDNYIGCTGSGSTKNRVSLKWFYGGGYNANMDVINCEFDSGLDSQYPGALFIGYYQGIRIIDCRFNYGLGTIYSDSSAGYVGQVELRNCNSAGGGRSFSFGGAGYASEYALFNWYLGDHVVNKNTLENIDTGADDITLMEQAGTNTIYKFTGGNWASPTSSVTIGTDASGWTPGPTNEGAIMLTEMKTRRAAYGGTNYYYYNLKVAKQAASNRVYRAYDYYEQHGSNYITSVDEGGVTNDRCIGPGWFRQDAAAPNSEPLLNEPPTNGTWYVGIEPIPDGAIFCVY